MDKLDYILDRINKTPTGISQLEDKITGVYLGNQIYLIGDDLYDVSYIFSNFERDREVWNSSIDIEIKHHQEDWKKVKKSIYDKKLINLMNERVYKILIQTIDITNVLKKINS